MEHAIAASPPQNLKQLDTRAIRMVASSRGRRADHVHRFYCQQTCRPRRFDPDRHRDGSDRLAGVRRPRPWPERAVVSSVEFKVEALSTGYRGRPVICGITLPPMKAGQITALVGPNAAGKSTLLRALAGLLHGRDGGLARRTRRARVRLCPHRGMPAGRQKHIGTSAGGASRTDRVYAANRPAGCGSHSPRGYAQCLACCGRSAGGFPA